MAITVKQLEALTAADKGRTLTDGGSLKGQVYVARDGTVTVQFRFAYKFNKASKTVSVGTWPKLGLADIRKRRDQIRMQVRDARASHGLDPVALRRQQADDVVAARELERLRLQAEQEIEVARIEADKQEALLHQRQRRQDLAAMQARMTVRELFAQWQRLELARRADRGIEAERSFKADVFPLLGDMAAADVKKAHVQEVIDTIKARATGNQTMTRTAKKTLADLRQMFGFAMDRDYIEADPTARIKKAKIGKDIERDRVLSEPELIDLFQKLPLAAMADTSMLALRLQLATVARIGEILGARWENVDFERRLWTLPETKNGKRHEISLSDFALHQLRQLKEVTGLTPWLFPATRSRKDRPDFADHVCEKTVTKQVGDRQRPGDKALTGRSKHVDALVLVGGKWTPHDLRRTGATMMAELGALPDVVERCLNHAEEKKVKRIYQRAQYEGPMREAWRLLGERLTLLEQRAKGERKNAVTMRVA